MAVDSFFGVIDSIGGALVEMLDQMSMALTQEPGRTLVTQIVLLVLAIELILALLIALSDSGQKAVSVGVQAILLTSFVYALTSSGGWKIIHDIAMNFPNELTSKFPGIGTTDSLKTDLAVKLSEILQSIMNPDIIQPSHGVAVPDPAAGK